MVYLFLLTKIIRIVATLPTQKNEPPLFMAARTSAFMKAKKKPYSFYKHEVSSIY